MTGNLGAASLSTASGAQVCENRTLTPAWGQVGERQEDKGQTYGLVLVHLRHTESRTAHFSMGSCAIVDASVSSRGELMIDSRLER
jgi:hypothetical protein